MRVRRAQAARQGQPVHLRHILIEQDAVEALDAAERFRLEGIADGADARLRECGGQSLRHDLAIERVVVDGEQVSR